MAEVDRSAINTPWTNPLNRTQDAVDTLIRQGGVISANTKSPLYYSLAQMSQAGFLDHDVESGVFRCGPEFEDLLISLSKTNPAYSEALSRYRAMIRSLTIDTATHSTTASEMEKLGSSAHRMLFLANELQGLKDRITALESGISNLQETTIMMRTEMAEMDVSLAAVESAVFGENSDS